MSKVDEVIELFLRKHREEGMTELGLDVPAGMFPEDLAALLLSLDEAMRNATPLDLGDPSSGSLTGLDEEALGIPPESPALTEDQVGAFMRLLEEIRDPSRVRLRLLPAMGAEHMRASILSVSARRNETLH